MTADLGVSQIKTSFTLTFSSSVNIAISYEIAILTDDENVKVKEVLIWETPRSAVTYSE